MEPISLIVGALVMGATAAVQKIGGQAVEDAYKGLRTLIVDRYKRSVAALEEDPSSETQKKAVEGTLAKTDVANDPEVLQKARDLTQALEKVPPETLQTIGVHIKDLEAMNARFGKIKVSGPGTGLELDKAKLAGDFTLNEIEVDGRK